MLALTYLLCAATISSVAPRVTSTRLGRRSERAPGVSPRDTIWTGADLSSEDRQALRDSSTSQTFFRLPPVDEPLVVLGPMDSGTHLLMWMLQANYPDAFERACRGDYQGCRWIWKHSMGEDDIVKVLTSTIGPNLKNTNIIAMIRSPLAQITGWRNDPWDMKNCVSKAWSSMGEPCSARIGATKPEDHVGEAASMVPEVNFTSTIDVVDKYYAQYAGLQRTGMFKNVVVVRYEDLLLAPTAVTSTLGTQFGWERPANVRVASESTKKGSKGRQEAINSLRNRAYLGDLPAPDLPGICRLVNRNLHSAELQHVHVELAEDAGMDATIEPQYGSECSQYGSI